MTLRRLAAKIACRDASASVAAALGPNQLGCGSPGGAHAAVHATRAFLESRLVPTLLLKLDFSNAFNTVRRDLMLTMVSRHTPELFHLVEQTYSQPSHLLMDRHVLPSATGVQQGDPLGPALFCLSITELVERLVSPLNVWYMDDGTLAGDPAVVLGDVRRVIDFGAASGLHLNPRKCEVFTHGFPSPDEAAAAVGRLREVLPGCLWTPPASLALLGVPLTDDALGAALTASLATAELFCERVGLVGSHRGLLLLRSSAGACKIMHILRGCDAESAHPLLEAYDSRIAEAAESLLNLSLTETERTQASLPVSWGGLGLSNSTDLARPGLAASLHAAAEQVRPLLQDDAWNCFVRARVAAIEAYERTVGPPPSPEKLGRQREWTAPAFERKYVRLKESATTDTDRARLTAVRRPGAGAWLSAIPSAPLGTLLDDNSTRICAGLRLGSRLVTPHTCRCGERVTDRGWHGLSCLRGAGRGSRHTQLNDTFARALRSAQIPCVREPPGLHRADGRRPDGLTLIPYHRGKALVWDGTVADTLAPSYVSRGASQPGYAGSVLEQLKLRKYAGLTDEYLFQPLAFETLGGPGPLTTNLLRGVCDRLERAAGDPRAGAFLLQRLSLDVQRGNAAAVMGTMEDGSLVDFLP